MTDRNRLIDLLDEVVYGLLDGAQIEAIAEHLLANGVILPPVKVGDTVWDNDFGYPKSYTVTGLDIGKTMDDEVEHSELFVYYQNQNGSITCSAPISIFGKTVFLTEKEATQALKERDR